MNKVAYIFPGQGSQYVGMERICILNFPVARELFLKADSILGFSLSKICFEGPEEELKQTKTRSPPFFFRALRFGTS